MNTLLTVRKKMGFNPYIPGKFKKELHKLSSANEKEVKYYCEKCGLIRSSKLTHVHGVPDPSLEHILPAKPPSSEQIPVKKEGLLGKIKKMIFSEDNGN